MALKKHFWLNYLGSLGVKRDSSVRFRFWELSRITYPIQLSVWSYHLLLTPPKVQKWPLPSPLDSKVSCRAWCPAAATSWPRCIYRWLYQLIAGLQHVASKLRRKRQQRSCGIFCLICSQNAAAPPALTSGPPGFTLVILDFKTILLCLAADTLDFNYSNAAFYFSNELITLPCSISLH